MALDAIEQHVYNNRLAEKMDRNISEFQLYKAKLQAIFDGIQGFIDDPDTPTEFVVPLQTKKAQGKTLLQNMLNGIT